MGVQYLLASPDDFMTLVDAREMEPAAGPAEGTAKSPPTVTQLSEQHDIRAAAAAVRAASADAGEATAQLFPSLSLRVCV